MHSSDAVLRRVMRRRHKGRRPEAVVDPINADDGPEFEVLVKHIAELGFGLATFTSRSLTLDAEYFVALVDDPAGLQGSTPEKFMNAILTEGLFEANLELRAQMNDAGRAKKRTPLGREHIS
jgi:hypothetical protein